MHDPDQNDQLQRIGSRSLKRGVKKWPGVRALKESLNRILGKMMNERAKRMIVNEPHGRQWIEILSKYLIV